GRNFNDFRLLEKTCDTFLRNQDKESLEIVSGGAKGADRCGEAYAINNAIKLKVFKADWDTLGKSAGYVRNSQMAEYADCLIAYWDGKSKGTKHMINLAVEKGLDLRVVRY